MAQILELGDLVPERLPIRFNRIIKVHEDGPNDELRYDTQLVTLQGFKYGPRCPVVVKSALRQILERYTEEVSKNGYSDALFQVYARDSFVQLIPGMSFEEADILAADDDVALPDGSRAEGKCIKTLKYLGYWREASTPQDVQIAGEVKAETEVDQSTTQESSPISA